MACDLCLKPLNPGTWKALCPACYALAAATRELLAACEEAAELLDELIDHELSESAALTAAGRVGVLRAAIAKARGAKEGN